jgi:hypothetical protein
LLLLLLLLLLLIISHALYFCNLFTCCFNHILQLLR